MAGRKETIDVAVAGDICIRNLTDNLENALIEEGTPIHKSGPPLKMHPKSLSFCNKEDLIARYLQTAF